MKKVMSLFMALVMVLLLCACGGEQEPTVPATTEATKPAPTVEVVEGQPIAQLDDVSIYIGVSGKSRELEGLPAYTYSGDKTNYKYVEHRYDGGAHVFSETDAAAFISYLNDLEADGWVQYSNNIINGTNLFATYTKDAGSLYCYYIASKNRAYVITSPNQNLEVREQDNQYQTVCTPKLTQQKALYHVWDGGMCYILRLSDGRFIVVDGGYPEADNRESQHLYDILREQNVLDKITVAAWIITHPHSDHVGVASEFLRRYDSDDLTIQQMIMNFPTDKEIKAVEPVTVEDTSAPYRMPTFLLALQKRWGDVPVTVSHTGQVYHFADAKIEFLHTAEDIYPKSLTSFSEDPINGTSTVFRVEIGGQKIMFYGDANVDCSADMVEMWGDYLKSDIMQANHHGLNGGSIELYELTDPNVVLVPMSVKFIPDILSHEYSRWIWNNGSGNIREVMLAQWEEYSLDLPYTSPADAPYFSANAEDPWGGLADQYKVNP